VVSSSVDVLKNLSHIILLVSSDTAARWCNGVDVGNGSHAFLKCKETLVTDVPVDVVHVWIVTGA